MNKEFKIGKVSKIRLKIDTFLYFLGGGLPIVIQRPPLRPPLVTSSFHRRQPAAQIVRDDRAAGQHDALQPGAADLHAKRKNKALDQTVRPGKAKIGANLCTMQVADNGPCSGWAVGGLSPTARRLKRR